MPGGSALAPEAGRAARRAAASSRCPQSSLQGSQCFLSLGSWRADFRGSATPLVPDVTSSMCACRRGWIVAAHRHLLLGKATLVARLPNGLAALRCFPQRFKRESRQGSQWNREV